LIRIKKTNQETKKRIQEIIAQDFTKLSRIIPWDGMHKQTVNKIMKIIKDFYLK